MSEYKCNHCGLVTKHNGPYCEIGMIEVVAECGSVHVSKLYHEECAKEIARELLELV